VNKVDSAIRNAEKAVKLDENSWSGYRNLVVYYTEKGEYKKAKIYIRRAAEINDSLLSETEFMLASAVSYIKIGDLKTAEAVLTILLERQPEIKGDEQFVAIVRHLKANMADQ